MKRVLLTIIIVTIVVLVFPNVKNIFDSKESRASFNPGLFDTDSYQNMPVKEKMDIAAKELMNDARFIYVKDPHVPDICFSIFFRKYGSAEVATLAFSHTYVPCEKIPKEYLITPQKE